MIAIKNSSTADGFEMRGAAVASLVAGRIVYRHPEFERIREEKQSEVTLK